MRIAGPSKVIVLAPHTDDGELGAGGTIARLIDEGHNVAYVAFSTASASVPPPFPPDVLSREVAEATAVLGIARTQLHILDFEVRHFFKSRQEILEEMVALNRAIEPDLILMPSLNDIHQDHTIVATEAVRAFKHRTILSYEMPWNNLRFDNTLFVSLSERHLATKVEALKAYRSQAHRSYLNEDFLRGQALLRGTQVGVPAAEVFEVVRMVL